MKSLTLAIAFFIIYVLVTTCMLVNVIEKNPTIQAIPLIIFFILFWILLLIIVCVIFEISFFKEKIMNYLFISSCHPVKNE